MSRLLHYDEWGDCTGWTCNDTSDLCSQRGLWWIPARMLHISPVEYVEMLITRFKPDRIKYFPDTNVLVYSWRNQSDMRRFKNFINAEARRRGYKL